MFFQNSERKLCSSLLTAAYYGDRTLVELLVRYGANVNSLDKYEETSLHKAARQGHLEVVRFLIINGAEIEAKTKHGITPLYLAAARERKDVALLLLDYGAAISADISLMLGDIEFVSQYLQQGGDPNSKLIGEDKNPPSWLYQAVGYRYKNPQLVKLLLTYGANVNEKIGDEQSTALHKAATMGYKGTFASCREIAQFLIEYGADIDARDKHSQTPLHSAARLGNRDIVQLLIKFGADVNAKNIYGYTPVHLAANSGQEESVKILIESGADINAFDNKQRTPLFLSIARQNLTIVEELLSYGAEINIIDKFGTYIMFLACNPHQDREIIKLLIKYGGDVNIQDSKGFSLLHKAVYRGDIPLVKLLLESGSKIGL
jgi:ankyrin repeat protein